MTEQQMTLKNEELQLKWKACISFVCKSYECYTYIKEPLERVYTELKNVMNSLVEAFQPVFSTLIELARDIVDNIAINVEIKPVSKSYPHSYPHNVDNFKINTRGFPRPPMRCARSRC